MLGSAGQAPLASTGTLLVRGSALNVVTLIASVAVGFFLMPFLIHALGDRWYGMWALIGSITSYYALLDLGMTSAVNRFLTQAIAREEETDANAVIVTALAIFGGIGSTVLAVSVAVAISVGWFMDDPTETAVFRQVVMILGVDVALAFPFAVFNGLLVAHYRFDAIAYLQLIGLALRTLLIVYVIELGYSIVAVALVTFAVSLPLRFASAVVAWRLFPSLELRLALFERRWARDLFGYGKYSFIAGSADQIRFQIDTLVVAAFLGVGLVTHYAIAERIAQLFMQSVLGAMGVIGPLFTRFEALGDRRKAQEILLLTTRMSVLAAVMIGGCILIFGQRFIVLWVGEDYRDAYWPMAILTGSFAVALMQYPSVSFVYATARHRLFAYMNSAEAVVNLGLSVILAQFYGMIGVSLGTAIPLLVSNAVLPIYVCRALGLELHVYFRSLGRVALIAAISQIPLFAYVRSYDVSSLAMMAATAFCYYALCGATLLRIVLGESDHRKIGNAISALRWFQLR